MLKVSIEFSVDEAAFLATVLAHGAENAASAADKFWLDRLHRRVQEGMMDVVAHDAEARLAQSNVPMGFPLPGPAPSPPGPNPWVGGSSVITVGAGGGGPGVGCHCGNAMGSLRCVQLQSNGQHP